MITSYEHRVNELNAEIEKSEKYINGKKKDYENAIKQHGKKIAEAQDELVEMMREDRKIIFSQQAKIDFVNSTSFDITRQMHRMLNSQNLQEGDNIVNIGGMRFNAVVNYGLLEGFLPVEIEQ